MGREKLHTTVGRAFDAFWAVVAATYPEATTGDLSFEVDLPLQQAGVAALKEWVETNVPKPERGAVLTIELEIDGDIDDAADIVDNVLDNGTLQDAIREYASDHDKDIDITSAVLK